MSANQKDEYKSAYINAVKLAGLKKPLLSKLHNVSENVVDKWLYTPRRYPDFRALFELWFFLKLSGVVRHKDLSDIIDSMNDGVEKVVNELRGVPVRVGVNLLNPNVNLYIYHNAQVTIAELTELLGKRGRTVGNLLRKHKISPGDCVDYLDEYYKKLSLGWRPVTKFPTVYTYRNAKLTAKELAASFGVSRATVVKRIIRAKGKDYSGDVSDIDFTLKQKWQS